MSLDERTSLKCQQLYEWRRDLTIEIQGIQFSGFPGRDFNDLRRLDFHGRVQWVRYRFQNFFLDTFDRIVALEHESYVWLCAVNLLTSAVEALSQFEFDDARGMTRFARFVERYFGAEFRAPMHLEEPPSAGNPRATTAAEHLYKYFRSGLAHSFCIEWGGLQHREDGAPAYLFETPQGHAGQRALGIVPRELLADFKRAVDSYFQALERRHGVVAVCMFHVNCNDMRWTEYLERIGKEAGVPLSVDRHSTRVSIPIGGNCEADVVVVSLLAKLGLTTIPTAAGIL